MTDDQSITTDFSHSSAANRVPLASLKPCQLTAGMLEVERKQEKLRGLDPVRFQEYLAKRPVSIALGPDESHYIIDRHHLALTLLGEGHETASIRIDYNFSDCTEKQFWQKMQENKLLNLYNEHGQEKDIANLPKDLSGLRDDPYRSLAGVVRELGGYSKLDIPFMEFAWANYFRGRIAPKQLKKSFSKAVKLAIRLAQEPAAADLPGYKKPDAVKAAISKKKRKLSNK